MPENSSDDSAQKALISLGEVLFEEYQKESEESDSFEAYTHTLRSKIQGHPDFPARFAHGYRVIITKLEKN